MEFRVIIGAGIVIGAVGMASFAGPAYAEGEAQAQVAAELAQAPGEKSAGEVKEATQASAPASPHARYDHFRVGQRNVKSMLADGKIIWIGTSGGVVRYDVTNDSHTLIDNTSGLLSNGIFHLSKVDGELWVGTYGGGLSVLDKDTGKWRNYNIPHGMGDAFIYDALKMPNGDVWLATWSGANRIVGGNLDDTSKWELYTVENTGGGLPNDWVYGLSKGANGEVWMATEGGLARFKDEAWTNWAHAEGLGAPYEKVKDQIQFKDDPGDKSSHHAVQKQEQGLENVDVAFNPNYVIALEVDDQGRVWAGTWGAGLSRFDGETWTTYTVDDGLPSNHIFMVEKAPDGSLWIGTSKGLVHLVDGTFSVLDRQDGLYSDNVFSMAFSEDGSVWIGSFGGVARFYDTPRPMAAN